MGLFVRTNFRFLPMKCWSSAEASFWCSLDLLVGYKEVAADDFILALVLPLFWLVFGQVFIDNLPASATEETVKTLATEHGGEVRNGPRSPLA